jgi:hypothetical protein
MMFMLDLLRVWWKEKRHCDFGVENLVEGYLGVDYEGIAPAMGRMCDRDLAALEQRSRSRRALDADFHRYRRR